MGVAPGGPKPVIYDTDMGSDDWLAALLLLRHPGVDLRAITVTGAGLAHARRGVRHALGLAALAGKPGVEIARGREVPSDGGNGFPLPWRENADGLFGLELPPGGAPSTRSAVEVILALSREPGAKSTLVAAGPLTNVAEALREDPGLRDRLEMVYVTGGSLGVPGGVPAGCAEVPDGTAEWNFHADPAAAAEVLESGAPVTLVPLDATRAAPVTPDFYERLRGRRTTPWAEFAFGLLHRRLESIRRGEYSFCDVLAAAVAVDETLSPPSEMTVRVADGRGRTEAGGPGPRLRVCRGADLAALERLFLDVIAPVG